MKKSRLSQAKQTKLMEYFVGGVTARCAADLVGVNRKTGAYYFHRLREIILLNLTHETDDYFVGEVEVEKSYFDLKNKGKQKQKRLGKTPLFSLLKRGKKVYTKLIPDTRMPATMPIIQKQGKPDNSVYSDCWHSDNMLDASKVKDLRINYSKLFYAKKNNIDGVENFWNQAKRHMHKFNGVPQEHFHLFLKEYEWRFNNPKPKDQLKKLKQWVRDEFS